MARRHVAKMLRRMAEIREKRARTEFLKAQTVLNDKRQQREDWVDAQVERETSFLEDNEVLTGAVLGMLDETRVVSEKRIERMDTDIVAVNGVAMARRSEHQMRLHRLNGAEKVEDHVKLQHYIDMENKRAAELEDTATANRHVSSSEDEVSDE